MADFYNPIKSVYVGKTFMDCEVYGAAVVLLMGHTYAENTNLGSNDFIKIKKTASISNVIVFQDLTVRRCVFYGITFLIPEHASHEIPDEANWLT